MTEQQKTSKTSIFNYLRTSWKSVHKSWNKFYWNFGGGEGMICPYKEVTKAEETFWNIFSFWWESSLL